MAGVSPLQLQTLSSSSISNKPAVHGHSALAAPAPAPRGRGVGVGVGVGVESVKYNNTMSPKRGSLTVVAAVGDVSSDGTTYLIAGAAAVALLGTGFPILFSRKDTCPECDGAGFVRKAGGTLRANAARKDQAQIVCANCNGLGKLNQVDK